MKINFVEVLAWLGLSGSGLFGAELKNASASPDGGGSYFEISYPGSRAPGALANDSTATLWIPDGHEKLRGIIVHQHGGGINPTKYGHMIAYDLHWQELARKWGCALLGPSFLMTKEIDVCADWHDPRNGSGAPFLKALDDLSVASKLPEVGLPKSPLNSFLLVRPRDHYIPLGGRRARVLLPDVQR